MDNKYKMDLEFNADEILEKAKAELQETYYRRAIDKQKEKLLNKKSIWDKIFPYKLIIIRKDKK